jgi:hypothetical protein
VVANRGSLARQNQAVMVGTSAHHICNRTPDTMNGLLCDTLQQGRFEVLLHGIVKFDPQPDGALLETDGGQLPRLSGITERVSSTGDEELEQGPDRHRGVCPQGCQQRAKDADGHVVVGGGRTASCGEFVRIRRKFGTHSGICMYFFTTWQMFVVSSRRRILPIQVVSTSSACLTRFVSGSSRCSKAACNYDTESKH